MDTCGSWVHSCSHVKTFLSSLIDDFYYMITCACLLKKEIIFKKHIDQVKKSLSFKVNLNLNFANGWTSLQHALYTQLGLICFSCSEKYFTQIVTAMCCGGSMSCQHNYLSCSKSRGTNMVTWLDGREFHFFFSPPRKKKI